MEMSKSVSSSIIRAVVWGVLRNLGLVSVGLCLGSIYLVLFFCRLTILERLDGLTTLLHCRYLYYCPILRGSFVRRILSILAVGGLQCRDLLGWLPRVDLGDGVSVCVKLLLWRRSRESSLLGGGLQGKVVGKCQSGSGSCRL
jgi:hypothetical protein